MNTTPRTVLSIAVLGTGLALAGCSSDSDGGTATTASPASEPATTSAETSEPAAPETATTDPAESTDDGALMDGNQPVDIQSYAGTYLAPTVEGGVALVPDPAANEVPAQWVVTPLPSGGTGYQIVTVAETDGEPSCLAVAMDADPSLASCDEQDPDQVFVVSPLDSPEQVGLTTAAGYLGVDTESGNLAVYDTGDQLSSTFTLVPQG
ncbi:hypothetical protein [Sanguibacter sp. Leaf3]|uniref:hypothetical protein n=1 Tax=Sanguibacter sp. Leaf3 TaxID=1736209 RepID=UPI0006FBFD27|nr:hypothetical protein [Sanguibacter sp. Leaf3]KQT96351.1 hypothetical protein ASG53_14600 [Sanguibacter sp. Leaf3]